MTDAPTRSTLGVHKTVWLKTVRQEYWLLVVMRHWNLAYEPSLMWTVAKT